MDQFEDMAVIHDPKFGNLVWNEGFRMHVGLAIICRPINDSSDVSFIRLMRIVFVLMIIYVM